MKTYLFIVILLTQLSVTVHHENITYLATNDMKTVADKVLSDLKVAKGIFPDDKPHLFIEGLPEGRKIASIDVKEGIISLDPRTYLFARSLAKDSLHALAFILGHELGHYIHEHGTINHNVAAAAPQALQMNAIGNAELSQIKKTQINDQVDESKKVYNEAEADFEGAFLGYLAGYKPSRAGKKLLSNIYNDPTMNLNDAGPGYPTLAQRIEIITKTEQEIAELTPYFDLAIYLTAIGQYQDAIPYLEKVLEKFQSREIYNNIGVLHILESFRIFPEPITKYKFPITLDANFRAPHPNFKDEDNDGTLDLSDSEGWTKVDPCILNQLQNHIRNSSEYFKKAIGLDQQYATAFLNLSIAQTYETILFLNDLMNVNSGYQCELYKADQFIKAHSNALEALGIVKNSLKGFTTTYYEQLIINENQVIQDYKEETYGGELLYRNASPIIQEAVKTEWKHSSKSDIVSMPNEAFLLSNIHLQIDLINIFENKLKDGKIQKKNPYSEQIDSIYFEPIFARALEINPNNQLALYNKSIALEVKPIVNTIDSDKSCSKIEKHNKNTISEIEQIIQSKNIWDMEEKFISDVLFNTDFLLGIETTKQKQNFKSKSFQDFQTLWNESSIDHEKRVEKCIFVIPKEVQKLKTQCGIKQGNSFEKLIKNYGTPNQSIELTGGNFHVYSLQNIKRPLYKKQILPAGVKSKSIQLLGLELDEISINQMNQIKINPSLFIEEEDGIIFKTNASGEVLSWILYYKEIKTENKNS